MQAPAHPAKRPEMLKAAYLADQEYLLIETRTSKWRYFPGPVFFLLVFGILTYGAAAVKYTFLPPIPGFTHALSLAPTVNGVGPGTYFLILFLAFLIFGLLWITVRVVRWIRTVYAVTNQRIIIQKGILSKDLEEIPIPQVRGVDVHQSFTHRILRYGTVKVTTQGQSAGLTYEDWEGIPRPFTVQRLIQNANQQLMAGPYAGQPASAMTGRR